VTSSWSDTSGGTPGFSVPGSADAAIFDGGGNTNAVINVNWTIASTTITSGYTKVITQNTDTTWTIYNNFTNLSTNSVFSSLGTVTFDNSSRSPTITTGGVTFYHLTFRASSNPGAYTTTIADSFVVANNLSVLTGAGQTYNSHTWSSSVPITISLLGNFSLSQTGILPVFGNANVTLNMTGSDKTFTVTSGTFNGNLNFNGNGITTISKAGSTSVGTTTFNQASGSVKLGGNSLFYNLVINSNNILDSSPDDGITSYNLTVYNNFTNNAGATGFVARAGTVTFDNSSRSPTITTGGVTFYHLTFTSSGEGVYIVYTTTLADNLIITGNFIVSNNSIDWSTHNWYPSSPITIDLHGNYTQSRLNTKSVLNLGNSNVTLNMIGVDKALTITDGNFNTNLNFSGTNFNMTGGNFGGNLTINNPPTYFIKGGAATGGTTTLPLGTTYLNGSSVFFI
jgi:hypothetical protein